MRAIILGLAVAITASAPTPGSATETGMGAGSPGAPGATEDARLWLADKSLADLRENYDRFYDSVAGRAYYVADTISFDEDPSWVFTNAWYFLVDKALPSYEPLNPMPQFWSDPRGLETMLKRLAIVQVATDSTELLELTWDYAEFLIEIEDWTAPIDSFPSLFSEDEPGQDYRVFRSSDKPPVYFFQEPIGEPSGEQLFYQSPVGAKLDTTLSETEFAALSTLRIVFSDLDHAHCLTGLSLVYDWLGGAWGEERRLRLAEKIETEARRLRSHYVIDFVNYVFDGRLSYVDEDTVATHFGRRPLLNNHGWRNSTSLGIAALVLDGHTSPDTLSAWHEVARNNYTAITKSLWHDGASNEGVGYWYRGLMALLSYAEARGTLAGDWSLYESPWVRNAPQYLLHLTYPNGQRVNFDDAEYNDRVNPTGPMACLAARYSDPLAQRLAWMSENYWSSPRKRRLGFFEILWFDPDIPPQTSLEHEPRHRFFDDYGLVTLRTSWKSDATYFAMKGGTPAGGHDMPACGTFVFFADSTHLVSDPGYELLAKRSAARSTLVIDGRGQHSDGKRFTVYQPEDAQAQFFSFLTTGSEAAAGTDLVSFATDMTSLYRYEISDQTSAELYWTDLEGLTEAARFGVWVDGKALLLLDRVASEVPYRVDSYLHLQRYEPDDDGLIQPVHRTVEAASGQCTDCDYKRQWFDDVESGTAESLCLGEPYFFDLDCDQSRNRDLNLDRLIPVCDGTVEACEDEANPLELDEWDLGNQRVSGVRASARRQSMDALFLDDHGPSAKVEPSLHGSSEIRGYHAHRYAEPDTAVALITALLPYSTAEGEPEWTVAIDHIASGGTRGHRIELDQGADGRVEILFTEAGDRSLEFPEGARLEGDLGIFKIQGDAESLHAVHLVRGRRLGYGAEDLVEASQALNLTLSYDSSQEILGQVQLERGPVQLTLNKLGRRLNSASLDGVRLEVSSPSEEQITFEVPASGTLKVYSRVVGEPEHPLEFPRSGGRVGPKRPKLDRPGSILQRPSKAPPRRPG